ncbi:unnamed protein product [Cyclocybe aegerita]|uniref:Small-subunit processome Utp12 domain-containing protein n=1 Tax=Cyclocybe aegerita TaxID=1973307 RepID=A0A8S0XEM0_CYCAE|nr:unnamed protein product [Cyclocybe aegerita]
MDITMTARSARLESHLLSDKITFQNTLTWSRIYSLAKKLLDLCRDVADFILKMASSKKSKPPKGRPASTSAISQPSLSETPPLLSSFSSDGSLFALITLAVDKHRLRIYNTASNRAIAEYTVQTGRVSSLTWSNLTVDADAELSSPNKRRKKKRVEGIEEGGSATLVVILGISDGSISVFSPSHSKVVRTLTHPTSTSAVLSLATTPSSPSNLWSSSANSSVHLWNVQQSHMLRSWKIEDRIAYTSLSIRPSTDESQANLLAAHHHICLFAEVSASHDSASTQPKQLATFTGHASSIKILRWVNTEPTVHRFLSAAEGDRFVYVWDTDGASIHKKPTASISLDSDVRSLALTTDPSKQVIITLSTSGKVSFIPIPADFLSSRGTRDKSQNIHSLLPRATLTSVSKDRVTDPPVINVASIPGSSGSIKVARLVRNIQPIFDTVRYLDDSGNFIQSLALDEVDQTSVDDGPQLAPNKRYLEPSLIAVGSGLDVGRDEEDEASAAQREIDGSLEVDLAELSLGQRLAAVGDGDLQQTSESDNGEGGAGPSRKSKSSKGRNRSEISVIPANSLTRTLIQALHSSDSRLLEMCLAHSDPALIRNTVRRLPPQLAIPLINACVERLGKGARAANVKGGGGGASSQRGMGLVAWINTVLIVHTGHLMTIPDLVARLSGLHSTLTSRLSLYESLLSLSGRLDTVLSQVEFRASTAPSTIAPVKEKKSKSSTDTVVRHYVEGESGSDEENDEGMDVEIEAGSDDEGSIEDIELGGESDSDEDEDDDSEESGEEGGFIDDEAEEDFSDEEDDEGSE